MGEETRNAETAVPFALFWSMVFNVAIGLVMIVTFAVSEHPFVYSSGPPRRLDRAFPPQLNTEIFVQQLGMPPPAVILDSASPIVTTLLYATGSTRATVALVSGLVVLGFSGTMGVVSSVSRLTWAWARDGGLPAYFGYVDAAHRVPLRAVVLVALLASLLALLNVGAATTYVAFSAVVSLSTLAMYLSYAIVLGSLLYARCCFSGQGDKDKFQPGPWILGPRLGLAVNVLGLVYTVYVMAWLPLPNYLPVTAANMNYCGPVFGLMLLGATALWFVRGRARWAGPNHVVAESVLGQDQRRS